MDALEDRGGAAGQMCLLSGLTGNLISGTAVGTLLIPAAGSNYRARDMARGRRNQVARQVLLS